MDTKTPNRIITNTEDLLSNGEIRSKDERVFECIGLVDELSSNVGLALQLMQDYHETDLTEALLMVQMRLVDIGSHLATPRNENTHMNEIQKTDIDEDVLKEIAKIVDLMDFQLPKLNQFILPGGSFVSAQLHICRAMSRRVERNLVPLLNVNLCDDVVFKFMNRLSDFFYVSARYMCMLSNSEEKMYKKGQGLTKRTLQPSG